MLKEDIIKKLWESGRGIRRDYEKFKQEQAGARAEEKAREERNYGETYREQAGEANSTRG